MATSIENFNMYFGGTNGQIFQEVEQNDNKMNKKEKCETFRISLLELKYLNNIGTERRENCFDVHIERIH